MTVRIDSSLEGIDWAQAKADLVADGFDNGRSAEALRRSFEQSQHVAFARDGEGVVGMARLLSDGVEMRMTIQTLRDTSLSQRREDHGQESL